MTLPAVIVTAAEVVVHGHEVHLKDKVTRCRGQGPARPYSGSKTPYGSYSFEVHQQGSVWGKREEVVGIEAKTEEIKRLVKTKMYKKPKGDRE